MNIEDALATEADHIVIATGSYWRRDEVGLYTAVGIDSFGPAEQIYTPDDILSGRLPEGPTIVYDDDHYYMANVIAEKLALDSIPVTFVTPEPKVSLWSGMTSEQYRVQNRLIESGIKIITGHRLCGFDGSRARLKAVYGGQEQFVEIESIVSVTSRLPQDSLYQELIEETAESASDSNANPPKSITRIGDCEAPAIIAGAVFSGHRYARELDTVVDMDKRIKYDRVFYDDV